jgi:hypothetical protein
MWDINYLAVAACGVASLVLGFIWYSALFGKAWQKEWGLTDEAVQNANMGVIFGGFLVLNLFAAFILGHVLATYGGPGVQVSLMIGFGVGLGFVATAIGGNYLFARKSLKLFLIDGGYWVLLYTIEGAIFGLLR